MVWRVRLAAACRHISLNHSGVFVSDETNEDVRDLVRRAQQHDADAFEQLVTLHSERLLRSIRAELGQRLRQRLESQDVMQQVYADALRSIDKFVDQGHDSFFRWLRRIAVNRISDSARRSFKTAKRRDELRVADLHGANASMVNLLDHLPGSVTGPMTAAQRQDRIRALQSALERLSPDHRQVLELRYLNQLSFEQTAVRMNRSERAIRNLCARAVIRLREALADAG